MQKETYIHLKELFSFLTEAPEPVLMPPVCQKEDIPILVEKKAPIPLKIHFSAHSSCPNKLNEDLLLILGGPENITQIKEIPNSRRIRVTIKDPALLNEEALDQADIRFYIRIGQHIIHIVP